MESARSGIPTAWSSISREVGTPATPGNAPAWRRFTRRSSACAAAEPAPRPSGMPGCLAAAEQGGHAPATTGQGGRALRLRRHRARRPHP
jgi:hypothetical protein